MVSLLVIGGGAAFIVAYFTYGKVLGRVFGLSADRTTPAHERSDGRDYHPARVPVLLGHHFSSIAGAGPIVGPIYATLVFGWAPVTIWIILGSIFIGGVHDFGSLALSVKQGARSIAQVARETISPLATRLLLIFVWLTLVYVLIVFVDLTAATFAPAAASLRPQGGAVASSSLFFIGLALGLGVAIYRLKIALWKASLLFVPLVFVGIFAGQHLPLQPDLLPALLGSSTRTWTLALLIYCFVASVTPVWILLQPRDYLSSFLLYVCLGGGLAGALAAALSGQELSLTYPAFLGLHSEKLGYLFPALFITVACGACSGFHSIVASGTTARQLDREPDARAVGYGSMLLEGLLALLSVTTVAILTRESPQLQLNPPELFAAGLGRFLALLGLPQQMGQSFGLLALSTFLLTTLDTGTRLGRYILEELLALKGRASVWICTAVTLLPPLVFSLMTFTDPAGNPAPVWRVIWPVFGSTNQLLGALALLVITLWLRRNGRSCWITLAPMIFMAAATMVSLAQLALQHGLSLVGLISAGLLLLATLLLFEAGRALLVSRPAAS